MVSYCHGNMFVYLSVCVFVHLFVFKSVHQHWSNGCCVHILWVFFVKVAVMVAHTEDFTVMAAGCRSKVISSREGSKTNNAWKPAAATDCIRIFPNLARILSSNRSAKLHFPLTFNVRCVCKRSNGKNGGTPAQKILFLWCNICLHNNISIDGLPWLT